MTTENRFWSDTLEQADPDIYAAVRNELNRQRERNQLGRCRITARLFRRFVVMGDR